MTTRSRCRPNVVGEPTIRRRAEAADMAKRFECGAPDCVFLVRSEDEAEIVDLVGRHAAEKHDRTADEQRVRERIETV